MRKASSLAKRLNAHPPCVAGRRRGFPAAALASAADIDQGTCSEAALNSLSTALPQLAPRIGTPRRRARIDSVRPPARSDRP